MNIKQRLEVRKFVKIAWIKVSKGRKRADLTERNLINDETSQAQNANNRQEIDAAGRIAWFIQTAWNRGAVAEALQLGPTLHSETIGASVIELGDVIRI